MLVMASYTTSRTPPPGPSRKTLGRNPLYNARTLQSHTSTLPLLPRNCAQRRQCPNIFGANHSILNPRLDNIKWSVQHRANGSSHGTNHKVSTFLTRHMLCTQMNTLDELHLPKMHLSEANGWCQSIHHSRLHVSTVSIPDLCRMQMVLHCIVFDGCRKMCPCTFQPRKRRAMRTFALSCSLILTSSKGTTMQASVRPADTPVNKARLIVGFSTLNSCL